MQHIGAGIGAAGQIGSAKRPAAFLGGTNVQDVQGVARIKARPGLAGICRRRRFAVHCSSFRPRREL